MTAMTTVEQKRIFDEWLHNHPGLFFKVVRAYAFSDTDRDDLFQEIAFRVWDSIPTFRGESAATTWIYRVALYAAIAWSQSERKHRDGQRPFDGVEHLLIATRPENDHRLTWLYDQIRQLSEVDRSVTLLLLDGYSYKEIAGLTGISESNVGVKIHRIKKHLTRQSEELEPHGV